MNSLKIKEIGNSHIFKSEPSILEIEKLDLQIENRSLKSKNMKLARAIQMLVEFDLGWELQETEEFPQVISY